MRRPPGAAAAPTSRWRLANGQFSSTYEGVTQAGTLDGNLMHGMTFQYQIDGKLEKAFVFLPRSPMVNTPRNRRAVGGNVMKLIAVHEFVHACGPVERRPQHGRSFPGIPPGRPRHDGSRRPGENSIRQNHEMDAPAGLFRFYGKAPEERLVIFGRVPRKCRR